MRRDGDLSPAPAPSASDPGGVADGGGDRGFGVVYGAAAAPVLGSSLTMWSSVLIFSGAAQFGMLGLLAAGAGPGAVLAGVAVLAFRQLPLGALLRPRLPARPLPVRDWRGS